MFHGTTIIGVKKDGKIAIAGDGQVTLGAMVMKKNARKVRRMFDDKVIAGFAGSTADAFSLFEKFEAKLRSFNGNLMRAAVELAKDWRTDRAMRRLEAMLIVANDTQILTISGTGDVMEPEDNIAAIGSGGGYALAAAKALMLNNALSARDIVEKAMEIAADVCIYTNHSIVIEELPLE